MTRATRLRLATALVGLAIALYGCTPYLNIGDSVGAGPSAYPYHVAASERVNRAIPGDYLPFLTYAVETDPAYAQDLERAGLVTISIGGNDLMLAADQCGPDPDCVAARLALFRSGYGRLLDSVQARTDGRIVVLEIYLPFDVPEPFYGGWQSANAAINASACERGIAVARVADMPRALLAGLHPTPEGSKWIAERVAQARPC